MVKASTLATLAVISYLAVYVIAHKVLGQAQMLMITAAITAAFAALELSHGVLSKATRFVCSKCPEPEPVTVDLPAPTEQQCAISV